MVEGKEEVKEEMEAVTAEARKTLLPLAIKAWAVATALLLTWGAVAAVLLWRGSMSAEAEAELKTVTQSNAILERNVRDGEKKRIFLEARVKTAESVTASTFTVYREAVAGATNESDEALRGYAPLRAAYEAQTEEAKAQRDLISNLTRDYRFMSDWNDGLQRAAQVEREAWEAKQKKERVKFLSLGIGIGVVITATTAALVSSVKR